ADESDARLAPEVGTPAVAKSADGAPYDVPSRADCALCHSHGDGVLGFSALQLSDDRDPLAPHASASNPATLMELTRRGIVRDLPARGLERPPRIDAATPRERAALGYLHTNCGSCHRADGLLAPLGLVLEARPGEDSSEYESGLRSNSSRHIHPGAPDESLLWARMSTRAPSAQMPPLATHRVDAAALELVGAWIREDLVPTDTRTDL
ncbi:MAG: hypothetical protein KDC14_15945, partial [Planctomycetes bacterium]|nr:hypothetical protein [Planctomycetota bacterium]